MRIALPYGSEEIAFEVPDHNFVGIYDPPACEPAADFESEIKRAIDHPIGCRRLEEIVNPGASVNIIVDDGSRPTPIAGILPVLVAKLSGIGVQDKRIRIICALGSHRRMNDRELRKRVGKGIFERFEVVNSEFRDPDRLAFVGEAPDGAQIYASKVVMDADIRIGIGNLVPHPVMGWSGGGKILFPGVAGKDTVAYFHLKASLIDENRFGDESMPVRKMMEGWVDTIGLDFIINAVLTRDFGLYAAVAGHYVYAHRAGVRIAKEALGCRVREKADVVVVSSHPADQDFWQSPKGFYSAEWVLRGSSGGTMILVSPNCEGVGPHPEFPEWMGRDDGDEFAERIIRGEPYAGDPLAMAVGNSMSKMRRRRKLVVVSDGVSEKEILRCGCIHYPRCAVQKAVDDAMAEYKHCRVAAISQGGETFLYD